MFFDTHSHFDSFDKDGTVPDILSRAAAAGVTRMCAVGSSEASNDLVVRLAKEYPGVLTAAVGYDRDQLENPRSPERLAALAEEPCVVAVGEIGLDYYYSAETAAEQQELFGQMLEFAGAHRLPVIVHSRYADEDTLRMLGEFSMVWKTAERRAQAERRRANVRSIAPHSSAASEGASATEAAKSFHGVDNPPPPGVLHCFTGDAPFAEALMDLGFMISFAGIVTFNNADPLRAVAREIPEDRLLIETDCPYLTPKPFRGKVNEPAYVVHVAEMLAQVRGTTTETLAAATYANAERLFQREG